MQYYILETTHCLLHLAIIILIVAEAYGMPMLPAYLNLTKGQDIKKGVNFAYAGSTALDKDFLVQKRINIEEATFSLSAQFDWFKGLKSSLCTSKEGFTKTPLIIFLLNI